MIFIKKSSYSFILVISYIFFYLVKYIVYVYKILFLNIISIKKKNINKILF